MLMATMLARMPDLRQRVQADHVPDCAGHCQECRDNTPWPCELYCIAATAERIDSDGSVDALPAPRDAR
jgi:hypothetical protein